jgi:SAM-dependent methyltransferase
VRDVRSTYDAGAPRYDEWSAGVVPDPRQEWARKAEMFVSSGEWVVELGCGTGVPVGRYLSGRYDYVGVDASPGMLARARSALPGARLLCADMHDVRFPPESCAAVVEFYSIDHSPRERHGALFAEIASWLRAGGVFIGNVSAFDNADDYEPNWLDTGPMRWSGFDGATNLALLARAGLHVVESEVIEQTEPDGSKIHPLWLVAQREG